MLYYGQEWTDHIFTGAMDMVSYELHILARWNTRSDYWVALKNSFMPLRLTPPRGSVQVLRHLIHDWHNYQKPRRRNCKVGLKWFFNLVCQLVVGRIPKRLLGCQDIAGKFAQQEYRIAPVVDGSLATDRRDFATFAFGLNDRYTITIEDSPGFVGNLDCRMF